MTRIESIYEPCNLKDALNYIDINKVEIISGGTDILVDLRNGKLKNKKLISIHELKELKYIYKIKNEIIISSATTFTEIIESKIIEENIPYFAEALKLIAGPQIRNMGTIGGNICNGITSADSVPMLLSMDAKLEIVSSNSKRIINITDFYKDFKVIDLKPNELLKSIIIDFNKIKDYKGHYVKNAKRKSMDIALVSSAVLLKTHNNRIKDIKISIGVAAPIPIRCYKTEDKLKGELICEKLEEKIREYITREISTRDTWKASKEYREELLIIAIYRSIAKLNEVGEKNVG